MASQSLRRVCALLLGVGLLTGCATTPNRAYHPEVPVATRNTYVVATGSKVNRCAIALGTPPNRYYYKHLVQYEHAWLEVDETGHLWSRNQLEAIKARIQQAHNENQPVLLAAYVHGWNDSAKEDPRAEADCSDGSGQVDRFYALMGRVGDNVDRMTDAGVLSKKPLIIGVWVGWRGADYPSWNLLAKPVSFASRGNVANKIGTASTPKDQDGKIIKLEYPTLHDAIIELDDELKEHDDRLLVWGLSFGGRIITRMFRDEALDGTSKLDPTSLLVTLNPAIGADCYEGFETINGKTSAPNWINISSHDDRARGIYYKIGAIMFMDDKSFCNAKSRNRWTALGFAKTQITHTLSFDHQPQATDYKAPSDRCHPEFGPTSWASVPPRDYDLQIFPRSNFGCYDPNSEKDIALFKHPKTFKEGSDPAAWLIDVDRTAIADPKNLWSVNGLHSRVFQTNLVRLVILRLYDRDASALRTKSAQACGLAQTDLGTTDRTNSCADPALAESQSLTEVTD